MCFAVSTIEQRAFNNAYNHTKSNPMGTGMNQSTQVLPFIEITPISLKIIHLSHMEEDWCMRHIDGIPFKVNELNLSKESTFCNSHKVSLPYTYIPNTIN